MPFDLGEPQSSRPISAIPGSCSGCGIVQQEQLRIGTEPVEEKERQEKEKAIPFKDSCQHAFLRPLQSIARHLLFWNSDCSASATEHSHSHHDRVRLIIPTALQHLRTIHFRRAPSSSLWPATFDFNHPRFTAQHGTARTILNKSTPKSVFFGCSPIPGHMSLIGEFHFLLFPSNFKRGRAKEPRRAPLPVPSCSCTLTAAPSTIDATVTSCRHHKPHPVSRWLINSLTLTCPGPDI